MEATGGTLTRREKKTYAAHLMGDPCSYCPSPDTDALDHIVARARGGGDGFDNLTPACERCNKAKRDSSLLGFLMVRRHEEWWALERRINAQRVAMRKIGR